MQETTTASRGERTPVDDLETGYVDQVFLLRDATVQTTRNDDPYLKARLADTTGEIPGIQWDTDEAPEPGLYQVSGIVETYKGRLQVKIQELSEADGDAGEYVRTSEMSLEYLSKELSHYLGGLTGEIGDVVRSIFDDNEVSERFLTWPAAKSNHHHWQRGLAEHTLSMCRISQDVSFYYREQYGRGHVDGELLIAGCLLHDLGKIYEYDREGFSTEIGTRGELVGHISECVALIHDAATATLASQETRDRLIHMVVAHHGRQEWGSPVEPKLLEAQILHAIDLIDSKFAMFREATDGLEDGEVSEYVRALGRRVVR